MVDHNRVRVGEGKEAFFRTSKALRSWKIFDLGWVTLSSFGVIGFGRVSLEKPGILFQKWLSIAFGGA